MREKLISNFIKNKFSHLLAVIIILFLIAPFLPERDVGLPIVSFVFLGMILVTLRALSLTRRALRWSMSIAAAAFLVDVIGTFDTHPILDESFYVVSTAVYSAFLALAIVLIIKKLFTERKVTGDTIKGAISIYFLIGMLFALLYIAVDHIDGAAFYFTGPEKDISLFYFSFVTMTTLGYGDIIPADKFAKNLAALQAVVGQMYIAILVARLVGLYTAGRTRERMEEKAE